MNSFHKTALFVVVALGMVSTVAVAGNVSLPNTFTAGTVIRAAEVNANFDAVKTANDDNQAQITAQAAQITSQAAQIAAQQTTNAAQQTQITTLQADNTAQQTQINTNQVAITAVSSRVTALETFSPARLGAYNVGALDFQPTVSGGAGVTRFYDEFGLSTTGRIGAPIHPANGATPTEFACWFTSAGSSVVTGSKIKATLWSIGLGGGNTPPGAFQMASVEMAGILTFTAPYQTSTTTFGSRAGEGTSFRNWDGAKGYRYLVEIEFAGESYPFFKAYGCTVRYSATTLTP